MKLKGYLILALICSLWASILYANQVDHEDLLHYFYSEKYPVVQEMISSTAQHNETPLAKLFMFHTTSEITPTASAPEIPKPLFEQEDLEDYYTWLKFQDYLRKKDFNNATALFATLQSRNSHEFIGHKMRVALAKAYFEEENHTAMHAFITPILNSYKLTRFFPEVLELHIQNKLKLNHPKEAFTLYARYINLFPHKDLHRHIFKKIKTEDPTLSFSNLFDSHEKNRDYIRELYARQRFRSVIRETYRLLHLHPTNEIRHELLYLLGKTYFKQYDFKRAISILKRCVHNFDLNDEQKAESTFFLARAYTKTREFRKANYYYAQLIKKFPNYSHLPQAYYSLCLEYKRRGLTTRYKRYEKDFRKHYAHTQIYEKMMWKVNWDSLIKTARYRSKKQLKQRFNELINDEKLAQRIHEVYRDIFNHHPRSLKKGIVSIPLNYDTFTLLAHYHTDKKTNIESSRTFLAKYNTLYRYGLGKLALEEMRFIDFMTPQNDPDFFYTKVMLAQSIFQYNQGLSIAFQKRLFRKEAFSDTSHSFTPLFYPLVYWQHVQKQAKKYKIDPHLILAVMREESHFNPLARSKSNAMGLMQIMAPTGKDIARRLREPWKGTSQLFIPEKNIQFGSFYLSYLNTKFNGTLHYLISGYNAGPGRTGRWVRKFGTSDTTQFLHKLPFGETRDYVQRVLGSYLIYKFLYS